MKKGVSQKKIMKCFVKWVERVKRSPERILGGQATERMSPVEDVDC